ncbi:hypothetical protein FNF29_02952 [Cafeteria roenbergensis]|uniref:Uncharacterized protein n=1 Tax=Cafeteria roenbergensis TaxID=33653 RepID=A0A5A8CKD5_CAFRO|nr:hypothetical protein FNF29_02952 [Cafeteria roenbergensis]|eukprot:KAA0153563.1 hypothetical protein FNF29_02952 [Cafeteria roenbergensis]
MATAAMGENAMASALWEAAKAGSTAEASRLLDAGAPVDWNNAAEYGSTALVLAAERGHKDTVELLLDRGADIEVKDRYGSTALVLAAERGHKDTVELLLDRGADIEVKDRYGSTALMFAAECGHKDTVELLLDRGADPEAKTTAGKSALTPSVQPANFPAAVFVDMDWLAWHLLSVHRPKLFGTGGEHEGAPHRLSVRPLLDSLASKSGEADLVLSKVRGYTSLPEGAVGELTDGMLAVGGKVHAWPSGPSDDAAAVQRAPGDGPGFASAPTATALATDVVMACAGLDRAHGAQQVVVVGGSPAYTRVLARLASLGRSVSLVCTSAEWQLVVDTLGPAQSGRIRHVEADSELFASMLPTGDEEEEEHDDEQEGEEAATASEDHGEHDSHAHAGGVDPATEASGADTASEGGEAKEEEAAPAAPPAAGRPPARGGDAATASDSDHSSPSSPRPAAAAAPSSAGAGNNLGSAFFATAAKDLARALMETVRSSRPLGTSRRGGTYVTREDLSAALVRSGALLATLRRTKASAMQLAIAHPTVLRLLDEQERETARQHVLSLTAKAQGELPAEPFVIEVMPRRAWGKADVAAQMDARLAADDAEQPSEPKQAEPTKQAETAKQAEPTKQAEPSKQAAPTKPAPRSRKAPTAAKQRSEPPAADAAAAPEAAAAAPVAAAADPAAEEAGSSSEEEVVEEVVTVFLDSEGNEVTIGEDELHLFDFVEEDDDAPAEVPGAPAAPSTPSTPSEAQSVALDAASIRAAAGDASGKAVASALAQVTSALPLPGMPATEALKGTRADIVAVLLALGEKAPSKAKKAELLLALAAAVEGRTGDR